jgi:hypothetical protein
LNSHPKQISEFLHTTEADLTTILSELLILSNLLVIMDEEFLTILNTALPILNAGVQFSCVQGLVEQLITLFQQKFEMSLKT